MLLMAKKTDANQAVSKYAEDWMPIKNIMNGMIQLDNNEYVTGVKIAPKNIFIMDTGVQQNTIYNISGTYFCFLSSAGTKLS